jgi:hypothetical protein
MLNAGTAEYYAMTLTRETMQRKTTRAEPYLTTGLVHHRTTIDLHISLRINVRIQPALCPEATRVSTVMSCLVLSDQAGRLLTFDLLKSRSR